MVSRNPLRSWACEVVLGVMAQAQRSSKTLHCLERKRVVHLLQTFYAFFAPVFESAWWFNIVTNHRRQPRRPRHSAQPTPPRFGCATRCIGPLSQGAVFGAVAVTTRNGSFRSLHPE